jgi:predicted Zn finger-like uncharacterized protein
VFRLSAETLRAAGGQVRCGRCGEVFNALARLAEDASAFPPSESPLEMEARADEILQSPAPPPAPAPPSRDEDLEAADVDFARLQLIDKFKPPRPDSGAPPRPDVASAPRPGPLPPAPPRTPPSASPRMPPSASRAAPVPGGKPAAADVPPPPPARSVESVAGPESAAESSLEFTLPPGDLDRIFVDPTVARTRQSHSAVDSQDSRSSPARHPAEEGGEMAGVRGPGLEVAEHVRDDMLAGMMQRRFDDPIAPSDRTARRMWGAAAAMLALILLAQIIHENREWLATHGPLRGPLRGLYGALGVGVQTPANLSSYQLRQWGVTGDPSAAGTLRVRASILNTAPQLQPYPLLRVTLANRFGTRIGTRDFEPAEYLGKPTVRMMTPGERADATLDILDPGKDAEGFEIDVCLRGSDRKISCTADAAPQANAPRAKS